MEDKLYVCCFSGHRPNDLPWGYEERGIRFFIFRQKLRRAILKSIKNGKRIFISGMALGFDMIAAETVIELKKSFEEIKLVCAIPCKNQEIRWNEESIARYRNILRQSDEIYYVSTQEYSRGCMTDRNEYMLKRSSELIAAYNGKKSGGTYQTIRTARLWGLKITVVKP